MPQLSTIDKVFKRSNVPLTLSDAQDPDRALLKVNDRFCAMTGYGRDECIGRNCRFLQGEDREQPARFEIQDALHLQEDTEVVLTNYTRSGVMFDNLLFIHHIRDIHGEVLYVMGSQFVIEDRADASSLDLHIKALDEGLVTLAESFRYVQYTAKRQLSASVSAMVHSAILKERLSGRIRR